MSAVLIRKLNQARERLESGDAPGAARLCQEVLARAPRNPDALCLFGITLLAGGQPREAVEPLQQALAMVPRHGAALENLGLAQLMLGQFAPAERALATAAALPGAPASVFMRMGIALLNQSRHAEAIAAFERARALDARNPDIPLNLGQALAGAGDTVAARREFEAALALAPAHADAMYNLGVLCLQNDDIAPAREWFERAIARDPEHADALVNLGIVFDQQQQHEQAIGCFRRALALNPERAQAHAGVAAACFALGSGVKDAALLQEAETAARRALALDPAAGGPYGLLADLYAMRGAREDMIAILETGYARTGDGNLLGMLLFNLRCVCDWPKWREAWREVPPLLAKNSGLGAPFALLCQPTTAAEQLACARLWASRQAGHIAPLPAASNSAAPRRRRLRIGYVSSDFREHAVSDLLVEILELHDRECFEIFAYTHGPDDHSPVRARLSRACEHFIDIARDSDEIAAARIRDDGLDILVDLNGYTTGARTGLLARRPCAAQINWFYAGTTGAGFIDYLIADNFIIPPEHAGAYSERVLRMPHCYLPNDRQRAVAVPLSRAEYGLPAAGFVFCCFNQPYKVTPELYACWMRLLHEVPASVLWLPDDNRWATDHLKRAAAAHGIAPERLVFAPRLPVLADHLGRYAAADLALDTFPYTSHTTAFDALWANCLLVGLCGETYAARVSGSVLTACGLPELVAYSIDEYSRLALQLATDATLHRTLRARLTAARLTAPLFDSPAFTRDLENLYRGVAGQA